MTSTDPLQVLDQVACCAPVTQGVLSREDAEHLARSFKALSDPSRVRLLSLIAAQSQGEACVCDLTDIVGLSQPTVSHHMKQLVEAGLVIREQRGKWAYYRVDDAMLSALSNALHKG
jgi:ArsR family transcriptional regulator